MAPLQPPAARKQKAHHDGRAFSPFLVAWGGIEPPTQGFSIQATGSVCIRLSAGIVTPFWPPSPCREAFTEPVAEPFGSGRLHGHSVFLNGIKAIAMPNAEPTGRTNGPNGAFLGVPPPVTPFQALMAAICQWQICGLNPAFESALVPDQVRHCSATHPDTVTAPR
jgi:hypothetical protein